jgi:LruC domain-containing protein
MLKDDAAAKAGDDSTAGGGDNPVTDEPIADDPDNNHDDPNCDCHNRPSRRIVRGGSIVAFEDLYKTNNWNDNDYNDFVMSYKVREVYGRRGLRKIEIDFTPKIKKAGYDHELLINLVGRRSTQDSEADAITTRPAFLDADECTSATLELFDRDGRRTSTEEVDPLRDITVFASTSASIGYNNDLRQSARLTVWIANPRENPYRRKIEFDRYRMMLYVKNTQKLLELVDINPTNMTADGYPYGFRIPGANTQYAPQEQVHLDTIYPKFAKYREYLVLKKANPAYMGTEEQLRWFENLVTTSLQQLASHP